MEIEPVTWVGSVLVPKLQKVRSNEPNYLKRLTATYAHEALMQKYWNELQGTSVPEVLLDLKDKIPNVRLVSLKVLKTVYSKVNESWKQQIIKAAQSMLTDGDIDVRQMANAIVMQL